MVFLTPLGMLIGGLGLALYASSLPESGFSIAAIIIGLIVGSMSLPTFLGTVQSPNKKKPIQGKAVFLQATISGEYSTRYAILKHNGDELKIKIDLETYEKLLTIPPHTPANISGFKTHGGEDSFDTVTII